MSQPVTDQSEFLRGVAAALEICRKIRDDADLPASWEKLYGEGYSAGAGDCCAIIINDLHPPLD